MVMLSNVFSIVGTEVYSDPPHYYRGNGFALGASVISVLAVLLLYFDFRRENQKKRRDAHGDAAVQLRHKGVEELGNKHPDFYYLT